MEALGLFLALMIGTLLGLLGGGGSILAVPVFVYVLGLDSKLAIALSLGVVGAASLAGTIPHLRARNVDVRTALIFAAGSAAGAFGGSALSRLVSGSVQLVVFAVVMLTAAISMLRSRRGAAIVPAEAEAVEKLPALLAVTLLRGAAVGVLTGFVGVGGGFLIVPALVLLGNMPMKRAVGTSLLVIAINSASGFTGYMLQENIRHRIALTSIGGYPLASYLTLFTAIAIAGIGLGIWIGRRTNGGTLRRIFAIALVAMAAFIIAQNAGTIFGSVR
ncbi:MAG TPA: sulfite exporter TauE/SafE family protein [Candidatus Kapabacteria bacterium]|nr:sulfite exporter TauE/SafE family protein [Candidatus Kapabacteria bacterium]